MVQLLIKYGLQTGYVDKDRHYNYFHNAIVSYYDKPRFNVDIIEIIKILLDCVVPVDAECNEKFTALQVALMVKNIDIELIIL